MTRVKKIKHKRVIFQRHIHIENVRWLRPLEDRIARHLDCKNLSELWFAAFCLAYRDYDLELSRRFDDWLTSRNLKVEE